VADFRRESVNEIQKVIKKYSNFTDQKKVEDFSEIILDASIECMQSVKPNFDENDLRNIMTRLTNNCDTYVRKTLSGMTLAFVLGTFNLPQSVAGSLTGVFINKVYGQFNSEEKTAVTNMMRDMYAVATVRSPFK